MITVIRISGVAAATLVFYWLLKVPTFHPLTGAMFVGIGILQLGAIWLTTYRLRSPLLVALISLASLLAPWVAIHLRTGGG